MRGLWQGLLIGGLVFFVTLGIYKLAPIPSWVVLASGITGGAIAIAGLIIGGELYRGSGGTALSSRGDLPGSAILVP